MSAAVQFLYTVTGAFDGTTPNPDYPSNATTVVKTVANLGLIDPDAGSFNLSTAAQHTLITYVGFSLSHAVLPVVQVIDPANNDVVVSTLTFTLVSGNDYVCTTPTVVYPGCLIRVSVPGESGTLRIDQLNIPDAQSVATLACCSGGGGGGTITEVNGGEEIQTTTIGTVVTVNHRLTMTEVALGVVAVAGQGYLCDTSGGTFTVTLPAAAADGAFVTIKDSTGSFSTNNLTVDGNGPKLETEAGPSAITATLTKDWWAYRYVYNAATSQWWLV